MILQQAIDHYGVEHQLNKVQEELGELITAISKYRNNSDMISYLIDEMADVRIMTDQLQLILEKQRDMYLELEIQRVVIYKLERLKKRIADDKNRHGV